MVRGEHGLKVVQTDGNHVPHIPGCAGGSIPQQSLLSGSTGPDSVVAETKKDNVINTDPL